MNNFLDNSIFWFTVGFVLALLLTVQGCGGDRVNYAPICQAAEPEPVDSVVAAVVGGEASEDRRATVKVWNARGFCSGTVIGPRTVLTAGHCKDPQVIGVENVGAFDVVEHFPHPRYNSNVRTDLRIVYVGEDLPPPYAVLATNGLQCERLVVQGYGVGGGGQLFEREVQAAVRYDEIIITTEGSCNGDSGGPLWALRPDGSYALVGVTSFGAGLPGICDGPSGYMNLLVLGDWVQEYIR